MGKKKIKFTNSCDEDIAANGFVEISIDPNLLNNYSNDESLASLFDGSLSEEMSKLKKQLFDEIMNIIDKCLTSRQKDVVKMTYLDGKTQNEISKELGRHQTAIHKALKGNIDYANDGKRYGGALKKIRKLCSENKKIKDILSKIKDIKSTSKEE